VTTHGFAAHAHGSANSLKYARQNLKVLSLESSGLRRLHDQRKVQHGRRLEKDDICAEDNVHVCVLAGVVLRGKDWQRDKRGCLRPVVERIFDAQAIIC
jgi:hypothetical protein